MWLITNFGFFSVVEKPDDKNKGTLTVRSRVKSDLDLLRDRYLPGMTKVLVNAGSDYKYRAKVSRDDLAIAASEMIRDIDYGNFKNSVGKIQGKDRVGVYHKIWDVLYALQTDDFEAPIAGGNDKGVGGAPVSPGSSYGGVLFNKEGQVLLVEPNGHYDNTVWTWPKGKPDSNETVGEAALREVLEETGYDATILSKLPGEWKGTIGQTEYFLMKPLGPQGPFQNETASTKWVDPLQAPQFISQTTKTTARERDLEVLTVAVEAYTKLDPQGS